MGIDRQETTAIGHDEQAGVSTTPGGDFCESFTLGVQTPASVAVQVHRAAYFSISCSVIPLLADGQDSGRQKTIVYNQEPYFLPPTYTPILTL